MTMNKWTTMRWDFFFLFCFVHFVFRKNDCNWRLWLSVSPPSAPIVSQSSIAGMYLYIVGNLPRYQTPHWNHPIWCDGPPCAGECFLPLWPSRAVEVRRVTAAVAPMFPTVYCPAAVRICRSLAIWPVASALMADILRIKSMKGKYLLLNVLLMIWNNEVYLVMEVTGNQWANEHEHVCVSN